jgi:cytochrome c oxidase assembly protein subunit 15
MVCPEWPTCNGGVWFPSFAGPVGLHLLHRLNGYALLAALLGAAALAWRAGGRLGRVTALAAALGVAQVGVGIANVLLAIPVEVTGLHSALAAALVLTVSVALRELLPARRPGLAGLSAAS